VPPFLCLAPSLMRGRAAAAAIALVNTVFSLGGFVGPAVVGWFTDATGAQTARWSSSRSSHCQQRRCARSS